MTNTLNPEKHQDLSKEGIEFTDLDNLLTISDIITVNIPLNEENKNLISKDKIKLMKKTATFINTSRAEIVDIFIFDLNFDISLKYIEDKNYIDILIDRIDYKNEDTKKKMEQIRKYAKEYLKEK